MRDATRGPLDVSDILSTLIRVKFQLVYVHRALLH